MFGSLGDVGSRGPDTSVVGSVRRALVALVLLVALISPVSSAAAEQSTTAMEPSSVDLDLPPLGPAARPALGPLHGLAGLIGHVTLGDPAAAMAPGDQGPEVTLLQARLERLGFRPGPIDGVYGGQTVSAVLALQKHEGLPRTGELDADTRAALSGLDAEGPRSDLLGDRIEIDIGRQLIFVVQSGEVTIINTSTGNEEPYIRHNGETAIARTPRGDFAIGTRYDGTQVGFLGSLYRPMYFRGPYAIHGSGSVPGHPASHGCARTSFGDMDYLWTVIPAGMEVYSYD